MAAGKEMTRKGGERAQCKFAKLFDGSSMQDRTADLPSFDLEECQLGKILGKGGFGTVKEVKCFRINGVKAANSQRRFGGSLRNIMIGNEPDPQMDDGQEESRAFIAEHCIRNTGEPRYALKMLSPETCMNPKLLGAGILDMAVETRILSNIEHPHIVKLRALARVDFCSEKYFIVMDRLVETLEHRIDKKWKPRQKRENGILKDRSGKKEKALYEERIVVAYELSHAINYLHERKIVYRDLKPENIGFDVRSDVKLFDFGLSKVLRDSEKFMDGTYSLTKNTGSPRYMAQEVHKGVPYNQTCDSYSFAILLWEMISCELPYADKDVPDMQMAVWNGKKERPIVPEDWPVPLKLLLKKGWCHDHYTRASMKQTCDILKKECTRLHDGKESGLDQTKRRSTFVFRPTRGRPSTLAPSSKRHLARQSQIHQTIRDISCSSNADFS